MFLSPREKQLLGEFLQSPDVVTVNRMISLLKVSKRTVYRELENLSESLEGIDVLLEKVSRGNYRLVYSEESRLKMLQAIDSKSWVELSTNERQRAILIELLSTAHPISMASFLENYQISNTTFYGDIKQLEERLLKSPLKITRNQGYEIKGSEKYRRLLMANVLESEINEYEFFHIKTSTEQQNSFIRFLNLSILSFTKKIALNELSKSLPKLSDRKLQHLILMAVIAVERVGQGHVLFEETYIEQLNKEMLNTSKRIFGKLAIETKQLFAVNEIVFYASLLSNFSNSFEEDFFEENFDTELAYLIKELIEEVSQRTEVDFFEDSNLFEMLLTHLSGVFSRAILQEDTLTNPILGRIMQQYSEVANAIKESLPIVFPGKPLTEEEIAYMVLHFANSLERSPKVIEVDIAGFSPSGLVSTSLLEMKLRHHFPFINAIHFYSIAQLGTVDLENNYDVVVSTSLLPGFKGKYLLVSPLLLEDEVKMLKEAFKQVNHDDKSSVRKVKKQLEIGKPYEEVRQFMAYVNELLERFFIKRINNTKNINELIEKLVDSIEQDWVNNSEEISDKLIKRVKQSPVGIPKTSMALFHAATEGIKVPIFSIVDLDTPVEIIGMDQEKMHVQRILLMLSPSSVNKIETKLLSKISGAIIMNDLYTEIFNSGNESIVYQLLSSLLIDEMKS